MIEKIVAGVTEKCPKLRLYEQPGSLTPSAFPSEMHLFKGALSRYLATL